MFNVNVFLTLDYFNLTRLGKIVVMKNKYREGGLVSGFIPLHQLPQPYFPPRYIEGTLLPAIALNIGIGHKS